MTAQLRRQEEKKKLRRIRTHDLMIKRHVHDCGVKFVDLKSKKTCITTPLEWRQRTT